MKTYSKYFIAFLLCDSSSLLASITYDEEDFILSKDTALISGTPFQNLLRDRNGVMTLCFKEESENQAALVFEMFLPSTSQELSLRMIRYINDEDCCGFSNKKIVIDNHTETLKNAYRAIRILPSDGNKRVLDPAYIKYASWTLPNEDLLEGLSQAEEDQKGSSSYGDSIKYVTRIMKTVGLNKLDFGWWSATTNNLKFIVDDYAQPRPEK